MEVIEPYKVGGTKFPSNGHRHLMEPSFPEIFADSVEMDQSHSCIRDLITEWIRLIHFVRRSAIHLPYSTLYQDQYSLIPLAPETHFQFGLRSSQWTGELTDNRWSSGSWTDQSENCIAICIWHYPLAQKKYKFKKFSRWWLGFGMGR